MHMVELMKLSKIIRLYPTKEQEIKFRKFCGVARWTWNTCLEFMNTQYEQGYFVKVQDMIDYVKDIKYQDGYEWILEVPEAVTKQAIKDLDLARSRYIEAKKKKEEAAKRGIILDIDVGFPTFHKKDMYESFYQRTDKIKQRDDKYIMITRVGKVKTSKFKLPNKVGNPRIKYDGKYWYLTFCYDVNIDKKECTDKNIGIDLGLNNMAVLSTGKVYRNINKDRKIKILERRKKIIQRKLSYKYLCSKRKYGKEVKSNNIKKLEALVRVIERKIKNIRKTYIHTITKEIVKLLPKSIIIEDLKVKRMLKNRHLSHSISKMGWYMFRQFLSYKSKIWGIKFIVADKYYASSQICSCCKNKKPMPLKLRIYECKNCGLKIDRDLNAAYNLAAYVD